VTRSRRRPLFPAILSIGLLLCHGLALAAGPVPALVGSLDIAGIAAPTSLLVAGGFAYLGFKRGHPGDSQFSIVDVSTPQSPTLLGGLGLNATVSEVAISGHHAYLAMLARSGQVQIVDISDRSNPVVAGSVDLPGHGRATAIVATRTRAYVGTRSNSAAEFFVLDISDPSHVAILGSYKVGGIVRRVVLRGVHVLLATSRASNEIVELNVADPASVFQESTYDLPGRAEINGLDYALGHVVLVLHAAAGAPDLFVLSLEDGSPIAMAGSLRLPGEGANVRVFGRYAYVASQGASSPGLTAVDISDPASPVLASQFGSAAAVDAVALTPENVVLASSYPAKEIKVVDPGVPVSPVVHDDDHDGFIGIACLGDSNTLVGLPTTPEWCERLAQEIGAEPRTLFDLFTEPANNTLVKTLNYALGGGTALDFYPPGYPIRGRYSGVQAQAALNDSFGLGSADALVYAFGTNDLRIADGIQGPPTIPQDEVVDRVVAEYQGAAGTVAATGRQSFFALTPPIYPPADHIPGEIFDLNGAIVALNEQLTAELPAASILDFWSDMLVPDYDADGLHFSVSGEEKRVRAAARTLIGVD
jgi:lysophospholipase L1-like esterase